MLQDDDGRICGARGIGRDGTRAETTRVISSFCTNVDKKKLWEVVWDMMDGK